MNLLEQYNLISEKELSFDLIPEVLSIQNEFLKQNNLLYYFLCTNKIIDIYINEEKLDEALELGEELIAKPNYKAYLESYKLTIDELIYIYITKQYYQRALAYLEKKKEIIDVKNCDEVNRLYLEYSYVHIALGEKSATLAKLKAILENNPSLEMKTVTLNNLTKLYIDNNNFDEAKKTLSDSIVLVNQINDEEGKRYCTYLQGLLNHLEGDFKEAKVNLNKLYKDINISNCFRENLIYLNEYFSLLLDMNEIKETTDIIDKYYNIIVSSDDSFNKLAFLKNVLRLGILNPNFVKRAFKGKYETKNILELVNKLELENAEIKNIKTSEIKEDELSFQMTNSEQNLYGKLLTQLNDIVIDYSSGNIRSLLIDYSSSLKNKVFFDEALYIILDKESKMIIPNIKNDFNRIYSYQYKKDRLYERELSFNDLIKTPVEEILNSSSNKISLNVTLDRESTFIDPISKTKYSELYKYMYAYPLFNNKKVYGVSIYLSKNIDFKQPFNNIFLNVTSNNLSYALISLFNMNFNSLQYNLLNTCDNKSNSGIFYYFVKDKEYILSTKCKQILNLDKDILSKDEFIKGIIKADLKEYINKHEQLNDKVEYKINYHYNIGDNNVLITEEASPYVVNGKDLYYCGRISYIELDKSLLYEIKQYHPLSFNEFSIKIDSLKDKSFTSLAIKFSKEISNNEVFNKLFTTFNDNIYLINGIYYYITSDISSKNILKKISNMNLDCYSYTIIEYPSQLVRKEDLLGLTTYLLQSKGYVPFTNESYASYISKSTIIECLEEAIITDNIDLQYNILKAASKVIGYNIEPIVRGIYNNSLKVLCDGDIYGLYKYIFMNINDLENPLNIDNPIYLIKIRNTCLYKILNNDFKITKSIIFELDGNGYNDEILSILSNKNCKVIVNNKFMNNISLESLIKYNNLIVGFNEKIDENILNLFAKFNSNYYFYDEKGFEIEIKETN